MTTGLVDPYTAAMTAPDLERHYFGSIVTIDSYFCVLAKGAGKRVWDATNDPLNDRKVAIKLSIECAKRDGGTYTVDQDCVNFERAWVGFTLPSLQKLGVSDLRALNGKSCHIKRVATGERYTNKSGEQKEKSAIIFLELFADADACKAASEAFYGERRSAGVEEVDLPEPPSSMPAEQKFALDSLLPLWNASGKNPERFTSLIEANPMIKKWYPASHPHVKGLMAGTVPSANDADTDGLPF